MSEEKENTARNNNMEEEETIDDLFGDDIDAQNEELDAGGSNDISEIEDVEGLDDENIEMVDFDEDNEIDVVDFNDSDAIDVVDFDEDDEIEVMDIDDEDMETIEDIAVESRELKADKGSIESAESTEGKEEEKRIPESEDLTETEEEVVEPGSDDAVSGEEEQSLESEVDEEGETDEESEGSDAESKKITIKELTEKARKKNLIEAAIFIAGRPVGAEELNIKLDLGKKEAEELVKDLAFEYQDRNTSIEIVRVGEKYSMQLKAEYTDEVKRFTTGGLIPEAVMRTLTVIALKQPIKKSLLVKIRGSGAYSHVKFLEERGFVDGYKKGRTSVLSTTGQFSDTFGLSRDAKKLKKQLIAQLGIDKPVKSGEEMSAERKRRKKELKQKGKQIRGTDDGAAES